MKKNFEDGLEYKFLVLCASGYILCYFMVFFFSLSLHKLIFTKSRDMNLAWNEITGCFFLTYKCKRLVYNLMYLYI